LKSLPRRGGLGVENKREANFSLGRRLYLNREVMGSNLVLCGKSEVRASVLPLAVRWEGKSAWVSGRWVFFIDQKTERKPLAQGSCPKRVRSRTLRLKGRSTPKTNRLVKNSAKRCLKQKRRVMRRKTA